MDFGSGLGCISLNTGSAMECCVPLTYLMQGVPLNI